MTLDESLGVIYILQSNYPAFYTRQGKEQAASMVKSWAEIFQDYSEEMVTKALYAAMLKKANYPPNIAEVNAELVMMTKPMESITDGEEAWGKAWALVKKYPPYLFSEQQAELRAELGEDELLRDTIRAFGGINAIRECRSDNGDMGTMRAQFIRIYDSYARRKRENLLIPDSLKRELIAEKQTYLIKNDNARLTDRTGTEG